MEGGLVFDVGKFVLKTHSSPTKKLRNDSTLSLM